MSTPILLIDTPEDNSHIVKHRRRDILEKKSKLPKTWVIHKPDKT